MCYCFQYNFIKEGKIEKLVNSALVSLFLQVYSASPIFGVEFEAEERVSYCILVCVHISHVWL